MLEITKANWIKGKLGHDLRGIMFDDLIKDVFIFEKECENVEKG